MTQHAKLIPNNTILIFSNNIHCKHKVPWKSLYSDLAWVLLIRYTLFRFVGKQRRIKYFVSLAIQYVALKQSNILAICKWSPHSLGLIEMGFFYKL